MTWYDSENYDYEQLNLYIYYAIGAVAAFNLFMSIMISACVFCHPSAKKYAKKRARRELIAQYKKMRTSREGTLNRNAPTVITNESVLNTPPHSPNSTVKEEIQWKEIAPGVRVAGDVIAASTNKQTQPSASSTSAAPVATKRTSSNPYLSPTPISLHGTASREPLNKAPSRPALSPEFIYKEPIANEGLNAIPLETREPRSPLPATPIYEYIDARSRLKSTGINLSPPQRYSDSPQQNASSIPYSYEIQQPVPATREKLPSTSTQTAAVDIEKTPASDYESPQRGETTQTPSVEKIDNYGENSKVNKETEVSNYEEQSDTHKPALENKENLTNVVAHGENCALVSKFSDSDDDSELSPIEEVTETDKIDVDEKIPGPQLKHTVAKSPENDTKDEDKIKTFQQNDVPQVTYAELEQFQHSNSDEEVGMKSAENKQQSETIYSEVIHTPKTDTLEKRTNDIHKVDGIGMQQVLAAPQEFKDDLAANSPGSSRKEEPILEADMGESSHDSSSDWDSDDHLGTASVGNDQAHEQNEVEVVSNSSECESETNTSDCDGNIESNEDSESESGQVETSTLDNDTGSESENSNPITAANEAACDESEPESAVSASFARHDSSSSSRHSKSTSSSSRTSNSVSYTIDGNSDVDSQEEITEV